MGRKKNHEDSNNKLFWIFQGVLFFLIALALLLLIFQERLPGSKTRRIEELENRIQNIQELVTVNQVFRDAVYLQRKKVLTNVSALFTINYEVKAGIEMDQVKVRINSQRVPVVYLPAAQVFSIDADDESIEEIFIQEKFGSIVRSDYANIIIDQKAYLLQEAIERGLLLNAQQQAELIITHLFHLAGFETVEFKGLEHSS